MSQITGFPNGITSWGSPQLGVAGRLATGNVFFVGSASANAVDDGSHGATKDKPFNTMIFASTQCTANNGDIVLVLPGHTEELAAAASLSVAGVTFLGLGIGDTRPKFTISTLASSSLNIDAASIVIENMIFNAAVADVLIGIDVNAAHCAIRGCIFNEDADNENFLITIDGTGSQFLTVEDCQIFQPDASNTHAINIGNSSDFSVIRRNYLSGDWGTAAIAVSATNTLITIVGNTIFNIASDNDSCINCASGATGFVTDNRVSSAAAAAKITATTMGITENYAGVNSEDLSGILEPVAT